MFDERIRTTCEELGWEIYEGEDVIELEKYSPAGEDYVLVCNKDYFYEDLVAQADCFDVDTHVEMWVGSRGENGVPDTVRELLDDAEAIKDMLLELKREVKKCLN